MVWPKSVAKPCDIIINSPGRKERFGFDSGLKSTHLDGYYNLFGLSQVHSASKILGKKLAIVVRKIGIKNEPQRLENCRFTGVVFSY
jgi:hypothetical protein